MRTFFTTLTLAATLATGAFAQQADGPTREDLNSDRLITELGLQGNQAEQVRAINDRFAQELAQLKQGDGTVEQLRADRTALLERRDAELKTALTAEQWTKLQELRAQWKAQRKEQKVVKKDHQE